MILTNFGSYDAEIKVGNRIAQIMLLKPEEVSFEEVSDFNDSTVRATGGFGLTNSKSWFSLAVKKMSQVLYDFSSFETIDAKEDFIKDLIKNKYIYLLSFVTPILIMVR